MSIDQQHPQYRQDREMVNQLRSAAMTDRNLADLARLLIRYQDFPGARDIQSDLQKILSQWQLTEETLFSRTRAIHAKERVYVTHQDGRDDWA